MAHDRSDLRWQHCEEAWQRLRWAREGAGFRTAAAFARQASVDENTYRAYERPADGDGKHIDLSFERARQWAPFLKVRWEWLYEGVGLPWDDTDAAGSAASEVAALVAAQPPEEQARLLEMVRLWTRKAS